MTKSFDEFWGEFAIGLNADENEAESIYEAGKQSKQAEVDGLQLKLSEDSRVLHNVIDIERKKCEKLQKRIDEIKNHVEINYDCERSDDNHSYWSGYNQAMRELFEISKGERE